MEVQGPALEYNIESLEKYLNVCGFATRRRPVGVFCWRGTGNIVANNDNQVSQ